MAKKKRGTPSLVRRTDALWNRADERRRGPKPTLSLQSIVQAAVEIADKEGLSAVTMQRVAGELEVTTMALYRYVAGKNEMIDTMLETVTGRPPDLAAADWRGRLEIWARASLDIFRQHPWALQAISPPLGPNRMAWLEAALAALSDTGMSPKEMIATGSLVADQVRGAAQQQLAVASSPEFAAGWGRAIERAVADERYPTLSAFARAGAFGEPGDTSWDRFEFGLKRVLDGIDVFIQARRRK